MCAPYARIQRIIFILIHLPLLLPPTFFFLSSFSTAPYLEPFLRLSDPRFILVKRERKRERERKERVYPFLSHLGHLSFWCRGRIWFVNCETSRVIDSPSPSARSGRRYLELKRFFGDTRTMMIYCETRVCVLSFEYRKLALTSFRYARSGSY